MICVGQIAGPGRVCKVTRAGRTTSVNDLPFDFLRQRWAVWLADGASSVSFNPN
jgi:hypothetical protein